MKTIVAGGRDFYDYDYLCEVLDKARPNISEVVCGCARGADLLGSQWAMECMIPIKEFPADWRVNGKAAGPLRNIQMAKYAQQLIAFWDGKSKGTAHMIETAKHHGLLVTVLKY